jgi:hypothetical protein
MLLFPETQERAQREIDTVVGLDRLPSMEDWPKLEYVDRLIQEVLRWRPALPTGTFIYRVWVNCSTDIWAGIPHTCYQDDVYRGYSIPKGAIVLVV